MLPIRLKHSGTFPLHMFFSHGGCKKPLSVMQPVSLLLAIYHFDVQHKLIVDKLDVHISACDIVGTTLKE